jgi:hypothetical protein
MWDPVDTKPAAGAPEPGNEPEVIAHSLESEELPWCQIWQCPVYGDS